MEEPESEVRKYLNSSTWLNFGIPAAWAASLTTFNAGFLAWKYGGETLEWVHIQGLPRPRLFSAARIGRFCTAALKMTPFATFLGFSTGATFKKMQHYVDTHEDYKDSDVRIRSAYASIFTCASMGAVVAGIGTLGVLGVGLETFGMGAGVTGATLLMTSVAAVPSSFVAAYQVGTRRQALEEQGTPSTTQ